MLSGSVLAIAIFLCGLMVVQTVHGGTSVTSSVTVGASAPVISSVSVNGTNPATITLLLTSIESNIAGLLPCWCFSKTL